MNTVTVKINGVEYNLKGKENEEYLFEVAGYVDSKFKEIAANNSKLSTSSVAVLAALNIADELFKCDLEIVDITKKKNSLEERHITLKERLRELKAEIEDTIKNKNSEIESLKNIIFSMEEKINEADNLNNKIVELNNKLEKTEDNKEEINNLKEEIIAKDTKNLELQNTIDDLKKKEIVLSDLVKEKELEIEESSKNCSNIDTEEVNNLKEQLSTMEQEVKVIINEKETVKARNKEMKFQLQNAKYKLLDLEKKLIDAQFDLALEKKMKNPLLKK